MSRTSIMPNGNRIHIPAGQPGGRISGTHMDDGLLDVVAIGPRTILGWLAVTARVLTRHCRGRRTVQHRQRRTVIISTEPPQLAQFDGDPVGEVRRLRMRVDRGALLVRV